MQGDRNNNWVARSVGQIARVQLNQPVPNLFETERPADQEAYIHRPGGQFPTPAQVVSIVKAMERERHPRDDGASLSLLERILLKIGQHGQVLSNFRVAVPQIDTVLLPANPLRAYLILVNTGTQDVRVAFGREADFISGIPIVAGGNYEPILGTVSEVRAVANAANQELVVCEGLYAFASIAGFKRRFDRAA